MQKTTIARRKKCGETKPCRRARPSTTLKRFNAEQSPLAQTPDLAPMFDGMKISNTGLVLPDTLNFDQWRALGPYFRQARLREETNQWMLADWLAFGGEKFCERGDEGKFKKTPMFQRYQIVAEQTGYAESTLKVYCSVASNVPRQIRREPARLGFSHHMAVAMVDDVAQQEKFLAEAEEKSWSVAELNGAVRTFLKVENDEPDLPGINVPLILNFTTQMERAFEKLEHEKPIDQWPRAQRAAIKQDLTNHLQKIQSILQKL